MIDVSLDTLDKKLVGTTQLVWNNPSDDEIDFLLFHMYYNAFKNSQSTFMLERGVPAFLSKNIDQNCGWGWTEIKSITDDKGNDLSAGLHYIQTDDKNLADQTVLKVPLIENIPGRGSIKLQFKWEAKIPQTMPRTGYNKEYYFMAQWFPKVGVYEPAGMRFNDSGKWNCHQYHSSGEYYSDFGNYDVSITVPSNYVVASSGSLIEKKLKKNNLIIYRYTVDDVIDFTWSASPHFVVKHDKFKEIKIKYYSYPYKTDYAERYFSILKNCMDFLDKKLGQYPYPTISIVDPPIHGMFTGGMEYPTLISSLSFKFLPDGIKVPETLVVHEFIHQYFMQMVATHEVEEPWMDEGLTSYMEGRILDQYLGKYNSTIEVLGITCGNKQWNRAEFFNSAHTTTGSNLLKSWEYKHGGYGDIAYNKVALWMQTLEGLIGTEGVDKILYTYFQRWKFKHPCRTDFIDVVNEIVAEDMNDRFPNGMDWFFDQVLSGTGTCDYSILSITNSATEVRRGFYNDINNCELQEKEKTSKYKSSVIARRLDELYFPIDITLVYEDGSEERHLWDGVSRSHDITIYSDKKIVAATIDKEQKIYMDKNFLNNSLSIETDSKGVSRIIQKFRNIIQHILEFSSLVI